MTATKQEFTEEDWHCGVSSQATIGPLDMIFILVASLLLQLPTNATVKAKEDTISAWDPAIHVRYINEALDPGLHLLLVIAIWCVSQWKNNLSLSFPFSL